MIKRDIELIQGDDYAAADGRALIFTGAGQSWPDLSTATLEFKAATVDAEDGAVKITATATRSVVEGLQHITVPLTAAQTNALEVGVNATEYALYATLSGRRLTLAAGLITVRGDVG